MNEANNNSGSDPATSDSPKQYSHTQEVISNIPYILMIVLGMVIFFTGLQPSLWAWPVSLFYLAYGIGGAVWIMVFVCPYCRYYDTRSCPCGYGRIAVKLRPRQADDCFAEKFKKHIPVIVPLWILPVIIAGIALIRGFSVGYLLLVVAFALEAFVVLPLVSTQHGCKECPQRDTCPWMHLKPGKAA